MAKAKQTTKKTVTKNTSTPTKAVAKKAVAAAPVKKVATKVTAVKKAAVSKEKPVVETKKAATKAKATATKAKSEKTSVKSVSKKAESTTDKTIKKDIKTNKEVKEPKSTSVSKKEVKSTKEKVQEVESTNATKASSAKAAAVAKAKAKAKVAKPVTKEVEIVDAIAKKSDLKKAKPGAIALRDLDRKGSKKKSTEDENIESFNPTRSSLLNETETFGPVFRYSDEDLNEFKELILKRLDVARENLNYYQALMARKDESGTEDTDNRFNAMEDGGGAMEREQLSQLAARQMQFIDHLEKALVRIENKTYGICRVTGKLIEKARLKAVPHATLSMEAKTNRR